MERSNITWEEVQQFEEIKGYGQKIWYHEGKYYFVTEYGTVLTDLVVYELPEELYQLLASGERTLLDIAWKLTEDRWPPTEEERRENRKKYILKKLSTLVGNPKSQELFTREELEELIPIAEKKWIDWRGKLPDNYVSLLKDDQLLAESLLCYFDRANRNQTLMCTDLARLLLFRNGYSSIERGETLL